MNKINIKRSFKFAKGLSIFMIVVCILDKQWWSVPAWLLVYAFQFTMAEQDKLVDSQQELIEKQHELIMGHDKKSSWIEDISPIDN